MSVANLPERFRPTGKFKKGDRIRFFRNGAKGKVWFEGTVDGLTDRGLSYRIRVDSFDNRKYCFVNESAMESV